jgi:hypothetical protein
MLHCPLVRHRSRGAVAGGQWQGGSGRGAGRGAVAGGQWQGGSGRGAVAGGQWQGGSGRGAVAGRQWQGGSGRHLVYHMRQTCSNCMRLLAVSESGSSTQCLVRAAAALTASSRMR